MLRSYTQNSDMFIFLINSKTQNKFSLLTQHGSLQNYCIALARKQISFTRHLYCTMAHILFFQTL